MLLPAVVRTANAPHDSDPPGPLRECWRCCRESRPPAPSQPAPDIPPPSAGCRPAATNLPAHSAGRCGMDANLPARRCAPAPPAEPPGPGRSTPNSDRAARPAAPIRRSAREFTGVRCSCARACSSPAAASENRPMLRARQTASIAASMGSCRGTWLRQRGQRIQQQQRHSNHAAIDTGTAAPVPHRMQSSSACHAPCMPRAGR